MGRKTMRKYKSTKRYGKKNTIKRKYKGGRTPIKKNLKGNEYFGFKLASPILNSPKNKSNESFGFSSSPKRKSTVRCNPNDTDCIEMERLKRIADKKETPTRKNSSAIRAFELFKKNRMAAKKDPLEYEKADAAEWKKALGKKALDPVNLNEKTIDYYLSKKN
jgi:hypothetical protein